MWKTISSNPMPRSVLSRDVCSQELHGDVAIELRIARQVHLAHPAGADLRKYFIRTNTAADQAPFRHGAVFDLLPMRRSHLASSYAARSAREHSGNAFVDAPTGSQLNAR